MLVILAAIRLLVLPTDGPDPAASGKLIAALEQVMTDTLFPERLVGRIEVRLSPPGADVYLDDKLEIEDAPAVVSLENIHAGRHTLRITKPGHKDFIAIVHVPFKGASVLDAKLRPEK